MINPVTKEMEITSQEKKLLLSAARDSIKNFLYKIHPVKTDYHLYPLLNLNLGAFVTLKLDGELRGCIGYIISKTKLFETITEAAKQAAFSDPRFLPLTVDELEKVKIEISVLSEPQPIKDYKEIIIGTHGLILNEGFLRAVLLPQVAVSNNFIVDQFLSALCEKGGLPSDYWRSQKLKLQVFTATIFSDDEDNE